MNVYPSGAIAIGAIAGAGGTVGVGVVGRIGSGSGSHAGSSNAARSSAVLAIVTPVLSPVPETDMIHLPIEGRRARELTEHLEPGARPQGATAQGARQPQLYARNRDACL